MDIEQEFNSIIDDKFSDIANKDAEKLRNLKSDYDHWLDPDEPISKPVETSIEKLKEIFDNLRKLDRKELTGFLCQASERDLPINKHSFVTVSESKREQVINKLKEKLKSEIDIYKTKNKN